jgi:hypothetical protein
MITLAADCRTAKPLGTDDLEPVVVLGDFRAKGSELPHHGRDAV